MGGSATQTTFCEKRSVLHKKDWKAIQTNSSTTKRQVFSWCEELPSHFDQEKNEKDSCIPDVISYLPYYYYYYCPQKVVSGQNNFFFFPRSFLPAPAWSWVLGQLYSPVVTENMPILACSLLVFICSAVQMSCIHFSEAFQSKPGCHVVAIPFWKRCSWKQTDFHCLISCQLTCLADGPMAKECWRVELELLSCVEATRFLEISTLRLTTKMMVPRLFLPESWCLWACPVLECPENPRFPPEKSVYMYIGSTFMLLAISGLCLADGSAMLF